MKIDEDNSFNDWLSNKVDNYELERELSPQTWIGIQNHLQKKKRPFIFLWQSIAAFLILGVGYLTYCKYYTTEDITSNNTIRTKVISTKTNNPNHNFIQNKKTQKNINEQLDSKKLVEKNDINQEDNKKKLEDKKIKSTQDITQSTKVANVYKTKKRKENRSTCTNYIHKTSSNLQYNAFKKSKPLLKSNYIPNKENYTNNDYTKKLNMNEMKLLASSNKIELFNLQSLESNSLSNEIINDSLKLSKKDIDTSRRVKKIKNKINIEYELFIIPTYSYRKEKIDLSKPTPIINGAEFLTLNNIPNNIGKEKNRGTIGFNLGANINIPIYKSFFIQTGIRFEQNGYILKINNINIPLTLDTNNTSILLNFITPPLNKPLNNVILANTTTEESTIKNRFYNLQIPINIGYKFQLPKNCSLYISSGISLEYHFSKNIKIYSPVYKIYFTDKKTLSNFNVSNETNINAILPINTKISLLIGPTFRYQILSSFKKEYQVKENLYSVGCKVGINFR